MAIKQFTTDTTADPIVMNEIVDKINKFDLDVGDVTSLSTTEKSNVVGAINEVHAETTANTSAIGQIASDLNAHKAENATQSELGHVKLPENWITATLQNGWTGDVKYKKDEFGLVSIQGNISGGTNAILTVLFTLPTGYYPSVPQYQACRGYLGEANVSALIRVVNNGDVVVITTGLAEIGFNIVFRV